MRASRSHLPVSTVEARISEALVRTTAASLPAVRVEVTAASPLVAVADTDSTGCVQTHRVRVAAAFGQHQRDALVQLE